MPRLVPIDVARLVAESEQVLGVSAWPRNRAAMIEQPKLQPYSIREHMMPVTRSEAACKAAETRRRKKAEDEAKYRKENYLVYCQEEFFYRYPAEQYNLDEVLDHCADMVNDEEHPLPSVAVWMDGELVGAAKRGGDGVAVVTAFHGPYPGCRRVLAEQ